MSISEGLRAPALGAFLLAPRSSASAKAFVPRFYVPCLFFVLFGTLLFPSSAGAALTLTGKLNVNAATQKEFILLPSLGDVKSEAIFSHREKKGSFKTVDSLISVKGIGMKTLEKIRPFVKLTGGSDLAIVDRSPDYIEVKNEVGVWTGETGLLRNADYFPELLKSIEGAKEEIALSMFIFKTTDRPSNRANRIMQALIDASKRSVRVSVFLERGKRDNAGVTPDNRATAEKLERGGVDVVFDGPRRTTHTKAVVIDGKTVFLGSHNLTHSALALNNELSIKIESPALASDVLTHMRLLR